jgi:hypothetical protein
MAKKLTWSILIGFTLGLNLWAIPAVQIRAEDVPNFIGQRAVYDQNSDMFEWTPFDSTRTWWCFDTFPGGRTARVRLLSRTAGIPPAPDTFPNAEMVELDSLGDGNVTWSYLSETQFYLYVQGIDFEVSSIRFIGNYQPDYKCYAYPVYYGGSWTTAWTWIYDVGVPYQATEQHTKKAVARGKVKVPFSGNQYWPCLVIRDHMIFSDNFGTDDQRWIYEWVVPGRFGGANGVAAAQSTNGATQDFMIVENFFKQSQLYIPGWDLRCPDFTGTTIWGDTAYLGPYLVKTTITDSTGVGADSLFYRFNHGPFLAAGRDSAVGNDYYYTIPSAAQPCTLGYFLWAEDSFSTANAIDIWNTDPICAPESTYYQFVVTTGIEEESGNDTRTPGLTCSPNPFHDRIKLRYSLKPDTKSAALKAFDATGRLVRSFTPSLGSMPSALCFVWDGSDSFGNTLPAGVYYIILEAGAQKFIERVIRIQ